MVTLAIAIYSQTGAYSHARDTMYSIILTITLIYSNVVQGLGIFLLNFAIETLGKRLKSFIYFMFSTPRIYHVHPFY